MRTYKSGSSKTIQVAPQPKITLPAITGKIPLVNLEQAVVTLEAERGLKLSVSTVREYCRSGRWLKGYHWVKPGRSYLINLAAVYESIASSSL